MSLGPEKVPPVMGMTTREPTGVAPTSREGPRVQFSEYKKVSFGVFGAAGGAGVWARPARAPVAARRRKGRVKRILVVVGGGGAMVKRVTTAFTCNSRFKKDG